MLNINTLLKRHRPQHSLAGKDQVGYQVGCNQQGFTLIELMVTVAIIGILAAIALPNYEQYVIKSKRSAVQSFMTDISSREKQYLLDARVYTSTLSDLNMTLPNEVSANYNVVIAVAAVPPSFTITATPISGTKQAIDGVLTLTDTGLKSPSSKW